MSNHYSFRDMIEDEYNVQANPIINEKKTLRENFEQLLNQMTIRENIKSVLNYLSKKLNFLKYEESKDIFINYFKKISDLIKEFSRHNLIFNQKDKIVYLTLINAISKFFKYYIKQKIIIDDNNKQILNEFSNFFKFFFELCQSEQNIDIDILNYEIELFIIIINFFSDLALKFESMIPIFLNNHLCFLMKNYYGNKNEYKRLLKNYCLCFSMTNYSLIDFNIKHNIFLRKIEETLRYMNHILEPEKANSEIPLKFEEKNLLFEKKSLLSISGLYEAKNAYTIILKIYKYSLFNVPKSITFDINILNQINIIFSFFDFSKEIQLKEIDLDGLSYREMNYLKAFLVNKALRFFKLFIEIYGDYMICQLPLIHTKINLALHNKEKLIEYIETHCSFLDLIYVLVFKFSTKLHTVIEEAIYNFVLPNTFETYTTFIERNDVTVNKNEKKSSKLVKKKKKNDKEVVNMLDLARNDVYNIDLEKYSKRDLEKMIQKYLKILIAYFNSNCALFIDDEKIMKFNSFIENLLYPPFAKFIHNLNDCFKETILNFLLAFLGKITKSKVFILPETLEKILKFVENNFHFEKNLEILNISNKSKNKIKIVYLLLNSYISQINFSTNKFSFTEIENIYSNLTKIKIEYSKKLEESYEFNYTFLEEDNHRHKLNASMIDQCKKLKENSKKIEMPDMANLIAPNDLKSSKKVVKLDDNSFITKDGIFFTSFKNEQKFNFRSKEDSLKTDFENDKNEQISLEDIN